MEIKDRQKLLFIIVGVIVGLLLANLVIFSPLKGAWDARAKQISDLKHDVAASKSLIRRKAELEARWKHMKENVLPGNPSKADSKMLTAKDRWEQASGIKIDSFSPQMQATEDPDTREVITTLSCRVDATGSMRNLLRFLFAVESDPMGLKLEDLDITMKDNSNRDGPTLSLGLTMSGLVLDLPQPDAQPAAVAARTTTMKARFLHLIAPMALASLLAAGTPARAQNTNTNTATNAAVSSPPSRMNLTAFQLIESRNIFDPNRRVQQPRGPRGPTVTVEYFGLNGAMTYENQAYAFFDGSGLARGRAFKPAEKINGYTIAAISNNAVKLEGASNEVVNLTVGMQLRRENKGPWKVVTSSAPAADSGSFGSSTDASGEGGSSTASGPEASVIERLMKKRAEEMKDQSTGSTGEGTGTNENH